MKKVFITEPINHRAVELLQSHFQVIEGTGGAVAAEAKGCAAILLRSAAVSRQDMEALPELEVVAKHGIGLDNIDVAAATEQNIAVVNAPFANINAVAEHTVAMLLAQSKRLVQMDALTRNGQFAKRVAYTNRELSGATVGLIGLGRIARLVAQKLSGFQVRLLGCDNYVAQEAVSEYGIQVVSQDELLRQSDFICLHTPLTEETKHLLSYAQLSLIKPSSYLINTSRGPVVDEAALVDALQNGRLAGAALDVYEQEPPVCDNPLFKMDSVILSPHNAALTEEALLAMAMDSAQGIVDYLLGRPPQFLCNPDVKQR